MGYFGRNSHQNSCQCSSPTLKRNGFSSRMFFYARLLYDSFMSIFYNEFISRSYFFDTLLEPGIWFVDNFVKVLGPLFVAGVVMLKSSVVLIAYFVGLPYYWEHKNQYYTIGVVIFGQFFFINVMFHYWKALTTEPGRVPTSSGANFSTFHSDSVVIKEVTSICKKCIAPKPPRTHHCSVCNRCVLKMDHHCPWINSCVGHFNHRFFFLYMVYTVLGCLFIMVFGFEIFYQEFLSPSEDSALVFNFFSRRTLIFYEAFVTTGTFLILGCLTLWHAKHITRGETCIEAHINKKETERLKNLGQEYKNPLDFGPYRNWMLFLGNIEGRTFWRNVLWPSGHAPKGNGLHWDTVYDSDIRWNDLNQKKEDLAKLA